MNDALISRAAMVAECERWLEKLKSPHSEREHGARVAVVRLVKNLCDLPTVPATTTLSPQPDIQQIIDYLDAAQYYFPEGDPDRVALKAASNILVQG